MSVNYSQKRRGSNESSDPNENIPNTNDIEQENDNQNSSQINNSKENEKAPISTTEINSKIPGVKQENDANKNKNKDKDSTKKNGMKLDVKDNKKKFSSKKENKNIDYQLQISSLEDKIKEIETNHTSTMIKLSSEGKDIDIKLKSISKENNILTNNLESLSSELDKMIYKVTSNPGKLLKQRKLDEQKKSENNGKQQLSLKNKEIQNKQKLIDILKKDNQRLKNEMERINKNSLELDENKLIANLVEKNKEIKVLENKIKEYKGKIEEHNKCERNIETLNKLIEY